MELIDKSTVVFRYMVCVGGECRGWVQLTLSNPEEMYKQFEETEDEAKIDLMAAFKAGGIGLIFETKGMGPNEEEVELIDDFLSVLASRRFPNKIISGYTTVCTRVIRHALKEENERQRFS